MRLPEDAAIGVVEMGLASVWSGLSYRHAGKRPPLAGSAPPSSPTERREGGCSWRRVATRSAAGPQRFCFLAVQKIAPNIAAGPTDRQTAVRSRGSQEPKRVGFPFSVHGTEEASDTAARKDKSSKTAIYSATRPNGQAQARGHQDDHRATL